MVVCPDCRSPLEQPAAPWPACGWKPGGADGYLDYLGTPDRASAETPEYIEAYDALAARNQSQPIESHDYVRGLAATCADLVGDVTGKDVCDVGSGRGFFVEEMLARGAKSVTAVDIAAPSLKSVTGRHGVEGFLANAENLPFEKAFDVLVATDIVEHVLNVSNFLVTANWALRDGGLLVVRVPYLEDMMPCSNFHGLPMHYTHLWTFDRTLVTHTVEMGGVFKVRKVFYDGFRPDYMNTALDRVPAFREFARRRLFAKYGPNGPRRMWPPRARFLMKPIEIGVVAEKVEHLSIKPYHADLAALYAAHPERNVA